jgi:hypothetical protein
MIDSFLQDLTYAFLRFPREAAFYRHRPDARARSAPTAMFSLVDRSFRPPPLMGTPRPLIACMAGRSVVRSERLASMRSSLTKWTKSFERTAGFTERDIAVGVGDAAREMRIGVVSASFFSFFDAPPALGRYFLESEDTPPEGARVAVASYARWQTEYGGRKDILGTKVQIGSDLYDVIGVSAPDFVGLWPSQPPAYLIPITAYGATMARGSFLKKGELVDRVSWGWMT